jgi:hypothetical protein
VYLLFQAILSTSGRTGCRKAIHRLDLDQPVMPILPLKSVLTLFCVRRHSGTDVFRRKHRSVEDPPA